MAERKVAWQVVVAVTAAVALLALAAAVTAAPGSAALWDTAWTTAALCALAGMLAARSAAGPETRTRWTWWAGAAAGWVAGQLMWDLAGATGSAVAIHAADVGWWAFAVMIVGGLLAPARRSGSILLLGIAEALPLIVAVMALTCAELWNDAAASALPVAARVAALAYPVLYVSAAVLTLQAMVGSSLPGVRGPGSRLVLIGIVAQAVAFIFWTPDLLDESYAVGATLIDPLWVLGLVAIGAGGAITAHSPAAATVPEREPGRFGGVLPAAVFVLLVAALVQAQFRHPPVASRLALAAGLLTCGAMLIGRGVLLGRRLRQLLDRERTAREELAGREVELARLNRRLAEDSRRDPLTGLLNRRALAADLAAQRDEDAPLAVALLDVDRFKPYNDRLGHLAGDQALRSLAGIVNRTLRAGDDAYRYGGEELLLVIRGAGADDALAAAERVRAAVAAAGLPHPDGIGGVLTVSIGVASGGADASRLFAQADAALYEAKAAGRDRVVGARESEPVRRPLHRAPSTVEEPVLRHLRSVLAVARAGAAGRGTIAVAETLAHAIRAELRFATVVVNLCDPVTDELHAVLVVGDADARAALEGTRSPSRAWWPILRPEHERCGAIWLPAGSGELSPDVATWTPPPTGAVAPDAWDAEDMLLLPLRASSGELLGIVSVDQPLSGRRPDDGEIAVLMAVADHAALALEQLVNRTPRLPQPHPNTRHASSHREPRIHRH